MESNRYENKNLYYKNISPGSKDNILNYNNYNPSNNVIINSGSYEKKNIDQKKKLVKYISSKKKSKNLIIFRPELNLNKLLKEINFSSEEETSISINVNNYFFQKSLKKNNISQLKYINEKFIQPPKANRCYFGKQVVIPVDIKLKLPKAKVCHFKKTTIIPKQKIYNNVISKYYFCSKICNPIDTYKEFIIENCIKFILKRKYNKMNILTIAKNEKSKKNNDVLNKRNKSCKNKNKIIEFNKEKIRKFYNKTPKIEDVKTKKNKSFIKNSTNKNKSNFVSLHNLLIYKKPSSKKNLFDYNKIRLPFLKKSNSPFIQNVKNGNLLVKQIQFNKLRSIFTDTTSSKNLNVTDLYNQQFRFSDISSYTTKKTNNFMRLI